MAVRGATGATADRLELASQVAELRAGGWTQKQVGAKLGVSRSYASELERDPDGSRARARKESYQGVCADCGGPTSGCEGPKARPERCQECATALQHRDRRWTRETVIDAIQRFAAANGRPPTSSEWIRSDPVRGYPPRSAVYRSTSSEWQGQPFQKWADAIEAAGFPRPLQGHYVRRPRATPARHTHLKGQPIAMRDYVILEQQQDGTWILHEGVKGYSEQTAIEAHIEQIGELNGAAKHRYVAISAARWVVRELQPVTTFKAVPVEA